MNTITVMQQERSSKIIFSSGNIFYFEGDYYML